MTQTPGTSRRDIVLAAMVLTHGPWSEQALSRVRALPQGMEVTGEGVRANLIANGLGAPDHHNAWGAMLNAAIKKGYLVPTGEYRHMTLARSHGRSTPVYRRT